jgi:hypothetical protein
VLFSIQHSKADLGRKDENRAALLEVGFPQAVMTLLEGYAETIPSPPDPRPLPLSIPHLKIVRTSIGVLLNASIGFGE